MVVLDPLWLSWIPCEDLAIDLRVRLGDWFRVIQLAHGANEVTLSPWGVGWR